MAVSILEEEVELAVQEKLSRLPPPSDVKTAADLGDRISEHGHVLIPAYDENGLELLLGGMYTTIRLEEDWDRTLVADVNSVLLHTTSPDSSFNIQSQYHFYATVTRLYKFQVPLQGRTVIDDFYILTTFDKNGIEANNVERITTKELNLLREPFPLCPLINTEYQELKSLLTSSNSQAVQLGFQRAFDILKTKINYELPLDK